MFSCDGLDPGHDVVDGLLVDVGADQLDAFLLAVDVQPADHEFDRAALEKSINSVDEATALHATRKWFAFFTCRNSMRNPSLTRIKV